MKLTVVEPAEGPARREIDSGVRAGGPCGPLASLAGGARDVDADTDADADPLASLAVLGSASMHGATVFDTALGTCGIGWTDAGICRFTLPDRDPERAAARLQGLEGFPLAAEPPGWLRPVVERVRRHLDGAPDPFDDVPLDLGSLTGFRREVSVAARKVRPGRTVTYSELAARAGRPGAARAVGQAMARNPLPLLVPCHRVLGARGELTGFSAEGRLGAKLALLAVEGADLSVLAEAGVRHVRRSDPALAAVIRRAGPYRLAREQRGDCFTALAESIVHQQVSMAAGRTIFGRLLAAGGRDGALDPARVVALPPEALRAAGLSGQKASYVQDLAERTLSGALPLDRISRMGDEAVVEALTAVRGLGRWSAEMFLMFRLGRLDVLPVDDLGLRKGAKLVYGLDELPGPAALRELAAPWAPFRSIGTWYLWRALESGGI